MQNPNTSEPKFWRFGHQVNGDQPVIEKTYANLRNFLGTTGTQIINGQDAQNFFSFQLLNGITTYSLNANIVLLYKVVDGFVDNNEWFYFFVNETFNLKLLQFPYSWAGTSNTPLANFTGGPPKTIFQLDFTIVNNSTAYTSPFQVRIVNTLLLGKKKYFFLI